MSDLAQSTLREACDRIDYGFTASSIPEPVGPRLLRITDIGGTHVNWATVPYCIARPADAEKYALSNGDIVVARSGASTGRSQWIVVSEPAVFASYLVRFRVSRNFDSRFVAYVLQSDRWHTYVDGVANGKTFQLNMSAAAMANFTFRHPSLRMQRAIAEVLGALDDKIAANNALAQSAELLAQTIYDNAEGSAQRQPISQVLTPVLGGTPSRGINGYWGGSELWVSARDITAASSSVIVDTEEHITPSAVAQTKAKPLPLGSVILTARGTVGKVARLAKPASFNQSCYGFIPGVLPSSILYFAIRSATERAKAIAHGSVFDTITMGTFDHLEIADFDREATSSLEVLLRPLLDTVTSAVQESLALAATRDTLLPQLISGKLRVRDAEAVASAAGA